MKRERWAMQTERRTFLRQSVLLSCATMVGASTVRTVSPAVADTKTDLIANMKWMNEPASWKRSGDGLLVRSRAKTDFCGQRHASVIFTRDFSDWSTMPDLSKTAPIWWRAVRKKDSIETLCSLDGNNFTAVRQGYFVPGVEVNVGIMCAAPEGPGFEAVFDDLRLEIG